MISETQPIYSRSLNINVLSISNPSAMISETHPIYSRSLNINVLSISNPSAMISETHPIYSRSLNINVLSISNPSAMISLTFSIHILCASSNVRSFHRNFSSSVSCITRGTSKVSCNHLKYFIAGFKLGPLTVRRSDFSLQ